MNIIKYKYRFYNGVKLSLLNIKNIDGIALHHMAHNTAGINDVTNWHMDDEFFSWIGYGYWIDKKGKIYECRGIDYVNAAVKRHNNHIISIGCQGDYSKTNIMPEAQTQAVADVILYIKASIPNITKVAGHNAWNDTSCPGTFFPMQEILKRLEVANMFTDGNKISQWAVESVNNIVDAGIMKGDGNGLFRPQGVVTREELAVVLSKLLTLIKK